jgi:hypothetical protein
MASTSSPSALEASQEPPPALTPNSELAAAEAATEKPPDDSSKLRMFLGILRKYVSRPYNPPSLDLAGLAPFIVYDANYAPLTGSLASKT